MMVAFTDANKLEVFAEVFKLLCSNGHAFDIIPLETLFAFNGFLVMFDRFIIQIHRSLTGPGFSDTSPHSSSKPYIRFLPHSSGFILATRVLNKRFLV